MTSSCSATASVVLTAPTPTLTEDRLVSAMVGDVATATIAAQSRAMSALSRRPEQHAEERLVVSDIVAESARGSLLGASLSVARR